MRTFQIILLLLVFSFCQSIAQRAPADLVNTDKGELSIQPILHGSVVFGFDGKTIYFDPYGGAEAFKGIDDPDLIIISDIHGDHLHLKTLESLNTEDVPMVVPMAVAEKLPDSYKKQLTILGNEQTAQLEGIFIEAIPMYNLPETPDSRHPKGRGNGYVLKMGGKTIYLSGDTEDIPEMRALKDIDIAFVCMNLPYTMDINQAASAVLEFQPKIVYPFHFRGKGGLSDVEAFKKLVNDKNDQIEVRLRNWYPKYNQ